MGQAPLVLLINCGPGNGYNGRPAVSEAHELMGRTGAGVAPQPAKVEDETGFAQELFVFDEPAAWPCYRTPKKNGLAVATSLARLTE